MKKCLILVVFGCFMVACGEQSGKEPNMETFADVQTGATDECKTNADCLQFGKKFCVQGSCFGKADPDAVYRAGDERIEADVVVGADVSETSEADVSSADAETTTPECEADSDCNDGNACTLDFCVNGVCFHKPVSDCCQSDADCDVGGGCGCNGDSWECSGTTGKCVSNECETTFNEQYCSFGCGESGCNECAVNSNCDDGNACTSDFCVNGVCFHKLVSDCCQSDADCDVGGGCGCEGDYWTCSGTTGKCVAGKCETTFNKTQCQFGCGMNGCNECAVNSNCDDGNTCTLDKCKAGKCSSAWTPGCVLCTSQGECGPAAIGCYGSDFITLENHCVQSGYCSAVTVACQFGCGMNGCHECSVNSNCNDGDACTVDACESGVCYNTDKLCMFGCVNGACNPAPECVADADCADAESVCVCVDDDLVCLNNNGNCVDGKCEKGKSGAFCQFGCADAQCNPPECESAEECDDSNPCTGDMCEMYLCKHTLIANCVACEDDADCDLAPVCVGVDGLVTYTGECIASGVCEMTQESCVLGCVPWSDESQYCAECQTNSDCSFGQYCTDNKLCGWTGDLQCKFHCPEEKEFAVVWYGDNLEKVVACETEVWSFPQPLFCSWGQCHPAFKFNLWDGGSGWSGGNLAELECNAASDELLLTHLGQGVMKVSLETHYCGFGNCL